MTPVQVEPESLRRVGRALAELGERGRDRDWLIAFVDHLDDRTVRSSPALCEGPRSTEGGEYEPA